MTRYEERAQESGVWKSLETVEASLERLRQRVPEDAIEILVRTRHVVEATRIRVDTADVDLVSPSTYEAVTNALTSLHQATEAQLARDEVPDLGEINLRADQLLEQWNELNVAQPEGDVVALRHTAREAGEVAEAVLADLREKIADEHERLAKLIVDAETLENTRQERITAMEVRIEQFSTTITEQETRLDTALNSQGARFDQSTDRQRQEFQTALTEERGKFEGALEEFGTSSVEIFNKYESDAKEKVDDLEKKRAKAEELVGIVAREGLSGGYEQQARDEEKQANRQRAWTIGLGIAAALPLAYGVAMATTGDLSAGDAIIKVGLSGALGTLANYTAKQSKHHREAADEYRRQQLALASLGPYLAEVDEDRRKVVIEAFSAVFFGNLRRGAANDDGERASALATVLDVLKRP